MLTLTASSVSNDDDDVDVDDDSDDGGVSVDSGSVVVCCACASYSERAAHTVGCDTSVYDDDSDVLHTCVVASVYVFTCWKGESSVVSVDSDG